MYHRFPADMGGLREQCEHIRRHYRSVSMQAVAESLRTGEPLPPNAVAVTIDDGHRDFLSSAYPVFREYDIPSTVFLVSDFIDGKLWLWQYLVHHAFRRTKRRSLSLDLPSGPPLQLRFETPEERFTAAHAVAEALNRVPNSERLRLVRLLPDLLEVEIPTRPPPEHSPLSWDEVRELAHHYDGVEFGAHTRTHPILSMVEDKEELRREVEGSKVRIEEELGKPVLHFCYPNGMEPHLNDDVVEQVERSGFRTAVTAIRGINFAGADPLRLYRVGVEPTMPHHQFREALAGVQSYLYRSPIVRRIAGI